MFRTLIIVAAIVLVFLLVKNRLGRKTAARPKTVDSSNTVKCLQCHIYVPADEAISWNDRHFCCRQHQRDWQENQSRED